MLTYVQHFLSNLVFSSVIESAVAVLLFGLMYRRWSHLPVPAAVLGTILTIPYVWFVFPTLLYDSPTAIILIGEAFAIIVESFFYYRLCSIPYVRAFLLSLIANAASYGAGFFF